MELFSLFIEYGAWSWLIIGFVLLALELLLPGGVFVWLGIAAIVTALVRFVVPIDAARQVAPSLRVLFTTGYARNAIVHHGRLDPGVDLLVKPFTQAELAQKIRHVLDQDRAGG